VAIDEFSALGSDHVLALLARGRESGLSLLLATQELSDLERAGRGFRDQVVGLTTVKIVHRQDVPSSAQAIAEMAGTRLAWDDTQQLHGPFDFSGHRGTRRQVERFRVHPNAIKTLGPGEAVLLVKSPVPWLTHVRVARPANREAAAPATAFVPSQSHGPTSVRVATERPSLGPAPVRPALPLPASRRSSGRSGPERHGGAGRDDQPAPGVTR
jgi:type IV secretory pathway TraG/TraD family ATPase VirD4